MRADEDYTGLLDIPMDEPEVKGSIIKVIGVGGGGGNAVNHMYINGIHDVSFLVCNTDSQALQESPVPVRLQLGKEGLGAGNDPVVGRQRAEESIEDVKKLLSDGTKMVFITAGMGGGTGTGAAPVIARICKDLNILTVGIVTIPFRWEGDMKINAALDGVEELSKHVDSLLVINNERLREIYSDYNVLDAFARADDILNDAAKSIAEIITYHLKINVDFKDVCTVLKDGGVAIMSTGFGEGEGRVRKAIENALESPLLNNNDIYDSKKVLLNITFSHEENNRGSLMMEEMNDVHEFMSRFKGSFEVKWGLGKDNTLGEKVKITILATGFGLHDVEGMSGHLRKKMTQEEANRQAEVDEKKAKNKARMEGYYGTGSMSTHYKRRPRIFIFNIDDLDNEDVIVAVESVPTANRTKSMLEGIRNQGADKAADENRAAATAETAQPTISFV